MYLYNFEFVGEGEQHVVVYDERHIRIADAQSIDEAIRDMEDDGIL